MITAPHPESSPSCGICGGELIDGLCALCLFGTVDIDEADNSHVFVTFGKYELLEELARGGMGVVYRAFQEDLKREVALKMIGAGQLAGSDAVQRFRTEAEAAAKLNHPNIVPVFEIGECEAQHYFTMRLIGGGRNIADWAKDLSGKGREEAIAKMVARVAGAVAFAHQRGILHRDLKPSNILIDEDNEPQVTDFGLAKFFGDEDASGLTLSMAVLGSPSYMAPEQAEGRHADVTIATDVYGLGTILYELLRGTPPFGESSPIATARAVLEREPPKLTGVSRDLATVCFKCLDKFPENRYPSATLLADDLERVAQGDPILARPISTVAKLWRWAKREPILAGLAVALALTVVLGFAGVTWQWRKAEAARAEQAHSIRRLEWRGVTNYLKDGRTDLALATLARRLREDPSEWQAAMYAMSIVDQQDITIPAGPLIPVAFNSEALLFPDGKKLAIVTGGNDIVVFDSKTGGEIARLKTEHAEPPPGAELPPELDPDLFLLIEVGEPPGIAVSPTNDEIAIVTSKGEVILWSFLDDHSDLLAEGLADQPGEPQFSTDGSSLSFRQGDQVEVIALHHRERERTVVTPGRDFYNYELGLNGERIGFCGDWGAAVFEVVSGKSLFESLLDTSLCSVSKDCSKVVTVSNRKQHLQVWDVKTRRQIYDHRARGKEILQISIDATGRRLAFSSLGSEITLVDLASGEESRTKLTSLYSVDHLVFSADGTRLASRGGMGRITIWDGDRGVSLSSTVRVSQGLIPHLQLSENGRSILARTETADGQEGYRVFQCLPSGALTRFTGFGDAVPKVCFNSDSDQIFTSTSAPFGSVIIDKKTGRKIFQEEADSEVHIQLGSADQSKHFAFTGNGTLYGWDVRSGKEAWPPDEQPEWKPSACLSPDGRWILAGHRDGKVRVHDIEAGRVDREFEVQSDPKIIRFAPDGSGRFIVGSGSGESYIWNIDSGEKLVTLRGHSSTVKTAGFSSDGHYVVTGSDDDSAIVWDSHTGKRLPLAPIRHLSDISHLEIHPNGKMLATASRDHTARIWDMETGLPLCAPLYQGSAVESVRFTRDGRFFVTRDLGGFTYYDSETFDPVSAHFSHPRIDGFGLS